MSGNKIVKYGIIGLALLVIGQLLYKVIYFLITFVIFGTLAVLLFGFVVLWFNWMWSMGVLT
jgi:hypothetical protein